MKGITKFIKDTFNNTFAFGVYIISMHIVFLPYMARHLESTENARLLLFIMISNIVTLSLGSELGVLYQVRYQGGEDRQDFRRLSVKTNIVILVFMALVLYILKFSPVETLAFTTISVLTNIRFYYQGQLRREKQFISIGIGNLLYLIGIAGGIGVFARGFRGLWVSLLFAEILSNAYIFIKLGLIRPMKIKKTESFKGLRKSYLDLSFASLLTNFLTYADKLLILPLLGSLTMSAYYAGTALSKMLFLVVNPINGVLLSYLATNEFGDGKSVARKQININIIITVLTFVLSMPMTYVATYIFYNQFLAKVTSILIPLSILAAFSVSSSLLRVIFLRYSNMHYLKYINLLNIISFVILATLGAKYYNIQGFAYGVAISKFVLWFSLYLFLRKDLKQVN